MYGSSARELTTSQGDLSFLDSVTYLERHLYVDLKFVFIFHSLVVVLPSLAVKRESIFSSMWESFGSFELVHAFVL